MEALPDKVSTRAEASRSHTLADLLLEASPSLST